MHRAESLRPIPTVQEPNMPANLFAAVEMAPRDPILGLNEAFNADTNPNKVNHDRV